MSSLYGMFTLIFLFICILFFQAQYDRPTNNSMSYDAMMSQTTTDKFSSMMSDFNFDNLSINPSPPGEEDPFRHFDLLLLDSCIYPSWPLPFLNLGEFSSRVLSFFARNTSKNAHHCRVFFCTKHK